MYLFIVALLIASKIAVAILFHTEFATDAAFFHFDFLPETEIKGHTDQESAALSFPDVTFELFCFTIGFLS